MLLKVFLTGLPDFAGGAAGALSWALLQPVTKARSINRTSLIEPLITGTLF
jgi:hypothetical protein